MLKVATKFAPRRQAFEVARAAGFEFAEFWLDENLLSNIAELVELAHQFPLQYGLHCPNRTDLTQPSIENLVELYNNLDSSALVIHIPMFRKYGDMIRTLDDSLKLGVENHRLSMDEFETWACNSRWLTLDVEHLWKFTLNDAPLEQLVSTLKAFLAHHRHKLVHVHLPGYRPGNEEHRPMSTNREMILEVLSLFADYTFDGLIVSEVSPEYQNVRDLRSDVVLYRHWLERHHAERSGTPESVLS